MRRTGAGAAVSATTECPIEFVVFKKSPNPKGARQKILTDCHTNPTR